MAAHLCRLSGGSATGRLSPVSAEPVAQAYRRDFDLHISYSASRGPLVETEPLLRALWAVEEQLLLGTDRRSNWRANAHSSRSARPAGTPRTGPHADAELAAPVENGCGPSGIAR